MDISKYEIEIKRHALIRAMERGVAPDMIEATIMGGCFEFFGKDYIRFSRRYRKYDVICVGQVLPTIIKIITIEIK